MRLKKLFAFIEQSRHDYAYQRSRNGDEGVAALGGGDSASDGPAAADTDIRTFSRLNL
jgi:hypothetical protein